MDLQAWLEHLVKEGHLLILAIDSNEDIDSFEGAFSPLPYNPEGATICNQHDGSLSTLLKTCGLVDILQTHHTDKAPATYNRGKKRLDYIFVSSSVTSSVLRSGILPFSSLFLSDHRPCYIDIDAVILFKEEVNGIAPLDRRGLQLTDPRKGARYQKTMKDQVKYHDIMEKIRELQAKADQSIWNPPDDTVLYEKVDRKNSEIMWHADRCLIRNVSKQYVWSPWQFTP